MSIHKATLIGWKKSKKRIGYFHPVFTYIDEDGIKRTYIRAKGMERTPFSSQKKYFIIRGFCETYEMTERNPFKKMIFAAIALTMLITLLVSRWFFLCELIASVLFGIIMRALKIMK
jgi:hypothetical protein